MNVEALVMTAAALHGVHAEESETVTGPVSGSQITIVTFPDADQAETFADACMAEKIPAQRYGAKVLLPH